MWSGWLACILYQFVLQNVAQKVTNTPIQPTGSTGDTHIHWNRLTIFHVYQPHSWIGSNKIQCFQIVWTPDEVPTNFMWKWGQEWIICICWQLNGTRHQSKYFANSQCSSKHLIYYFLMLWCSRRLVNFSNCYQCWTPLFILNK